MRHLALFCVTTVAAAGPALGAVTGGPVTRGPATVAPGYAQILPRGTLQFSAGGGAVVWQVDGTVGGGAGSGTITQAGLYTAPASLAGPAAVTVSAVSVADPAMAATSVVSVLPVLPAGRVYVVAPGGSDANPGTLGAPFATLQHGADVAVAGDTVLARQGVYNALLTPAHSGDAAHGPVTFASYPGETATLDGTGLAIPNGQNGLVTLADVSHVIVQGFELRNYASSTRSHVPVGIFVTGAGTDVQLVGNHVHAITTTAPTTPNQCASNALGIAVYGNRAPASIGNLVVSGNELDHLVTGCSESMSIDGNVDGFLVSANVVHDNDNIGIDGIGFERVSPDPAYDQARHGEIRGNLVYNITSYGNPDYGRQYAADGLYVDGGTRITIEQNVVHDTDIGIELASEHKGRLTSLVVARNNVVFRNNSNGISIGGYGAARGGTDRCMILGNTLFDDDTKNTGSGELQIQFNATNNVMANNIVYAGRAGLFVHNATRHAGPPAALDYNLYFSEGGAGQFVWNRVRYAGLAKFQAGTGEEAHGLSGDPLFRDLALPDLDVLAASPARGRGADLGAVLGASDIAGNARVMGGLVTIGAYEQ